MDYCAFSDKSRRTVCSCDEYLTVLCKIDGYRVFINEDIGELTLFPSTSSSSSIHLRLLINHVM